MAKQTFVSMNRSQSILLVVGVLFMAVIIGASNLLEEVDQFGYSPLILLSVVASAVMFFFWLRKPVLALYAAIFIVLLPASLIPAEINSLLNRSISMIALAVWLLDVIIKRRKVFLTGTAILMLCFLIWSGVSLIWSDFFAPGFTTLQMYGMRWIVYLILIANQIRTKKDLDGLMNIVALNGLLLVIVSVVSILLQGYIAGTRLQVLDENQNALGISLLVTTPAVLWWAMNSPSRILPLKQILAALYILVSIGLIGLSGSRGSAISLGIMLFSFLAWKQTRKWGLISLVVVIAALIIAPILFTTTIERFLGAPGETVLGGRELLWPAGWQLIRDHALVGVGVGNSDYRVIPYLFNFNSMLVMAYTGGAPLHNPVLVVWADTGIFGLLLYLAVLASAVRSFIKQYFRRRQSKNQYLMVFFALIAATFLGYSASWIKGGGMETDFSYFLMLAWLLVPSQIQDEGIGARGLIAANPTESTILG